MKGWKTVQIGCVADIFDGPHATPNIVDSGAIFLGIDALNQGRINLKKTRCVTPEDYKKWTRRVTPQQGDVVFSYETRLGEAALIPEGLKCCLGRRMGLIRAKQTVLDPKFFLYYYLSPTFQEVIRLKTILGATVNRISIKEFPTFPVLLPPLEEQQSIAHILGTLDDKIELNRRQNATLEAMAQAIFKDWFVDFGPVRAKMEGRQPEGMSREIADLFPDRLDGEGKPEGWKRGVVGELTTHIIRGITPKYSEEGVLVLNQKCIRDNQVNLLLGRRHVGKINNDKILKHGDILINSTGIGTLGRVAQLMNIEGESTVDSHVTIVRPEKNYINFLGINLSMRQKEIEFLGEGSTGQTELNRQKIFSLDTIFPTFNIIEVFDKLVSSLRDKQPILYKENEALSAIRDTLLPKLISGELRVPDAEKMVADIV